MSATFTLQSMPIGSLFSRLRARVQGNGNGGGAGRNATRDAENVDVGGVGADAGAAGGAKEDGGKESGGTKKDEGEVIDADFEMVDDDKNKK